MVRTSQGYTDPMSDYETTPTPDADRTVTDVDDELDPESPSDSTVVNPPQQDADRPVPEDEEPDDLLQEENAATSLDQPSDQSS
jgi:hypothetical protein